MELYSQPLFTQRLLLRPYEKGDAPAIFEWARDPAVTKFLTWDPHADILVTKKYLDYKLAYQEAPRHYGWILALHTVPIGSIDVVNEFSDGGFEIGYCLARAYWHQGYMGEAFHAVLRFLFNETAFTYSLMRAVKENVYSRRIIEKEGYDFLFYADQVIKIKGPTRKVAVYRLEKKRFRD